MQIEIHVKEYFINYDKFNNRNGSNNSSCNSDNDINYDNVIKILPFFGDNNNKL